MFHSCPHPSSASRPRQSFHVKMSRRFPFYVLFWLSLNCFFCSSVSLCLSLSVWRLLRAAAGHTIRCEQGRVQPLTFHIGILICGSPSGGPQRAGLMSFFSTCTLSLVFVCVMEDGWSGPPCSSSPHGTIWKGSEVMELFFFWVLCLSGWITSQSFWPYCCPATSLHGCMHVAPLTGAMLVSLLCLSIETESTQLRRRENSVKRWTRAFPYLKCPGITLAAEKLY